MGVTTQKTIRAITLKMMGPTTQKTMRPTTNLNTNFEIPTAAITKTLAVRKRIANIKIRGRIEVKIETRSHMWIGENPTKMTTMPRKVRILRAFRPAMASRAIRRRRPLTIMVR